MTIDPFRALLAPKVCGFATAEMSEDEAMGPAPLLPDDSGEWPPATVLCDEGKHEVLPETDCPHCGCDPKCAGCTGKER